MRTRIPSRIEPALCARVNPGHPLARALAGCWLLNEGAGQVVHDASEHRLDGVFSGGPMWSPGACGHAVEFDGNDDWITMGNCLNPGTDDLSVLALVRYGVAVQPDSWSVYHFGGIAGKGYVDNLGTGYGLYVDVDNRVCWQIRNQATVFEIASDDALNDGRWRLAVGVCDRDDATGVRLYIDGVRQSATANPAALNAVALNGSRSFAIGSRQGGGDGSWFWDFAGSVAMVCVWRRVLTEGEIRSLQRDPFGLFACPRNIAGLASLAQAFVLCAGAIQATTSALGTIRVTRNLSGSTAGSASVGGALTVTGFVSLSGRVSARSGLRAALRTTPRATFTDTVQIERHWRSDVLLNGVTRTAFQLGTSLTQGWFWVRSRGCTAVYRGPSLTHVDLARILYVAEPDAREIRLPEYLSHSAGSTCCYLVRRFNGCGRQDRTTTAAMALRIGPGGQLAETGPNAVVGFSGEQTGESGLRLVWFYYPLDQESLPAQFNIYRHDPRATHPGDLIGIVHYQGRRYYYHLMSGAVANEQHSFIVKAAGKDGVEGRPSMLPVRQVSAVAPESAAIVAARAV